MEIEFSNIWLICLNISFAAYLIITSILAYKYKSKMTSEAYHHFLSHSFIILFFFIGINVYLTQGYIIWLVFSFLHLMQHVGKENMRLINSSRWNKDIHDEHINEEKENGKSSV